MAFTKRYYLAALVIGFSAGSESLGLAATTGAEAQQHVGIVAQVGDEAVSSVDVDNRIKFIITTSHMSNTPDVLARIRPQVIRSLVDEKLEVQEATKNDIKINPKDIDDAIEAIEQQRGMPAGEIFRMLEAGHVPKETFTQQIKAQLSWNKLVGKKIRPQVHVSDAEITLIEDRVPSSAPAHSEIKHDAATEYKIAVVTLPVDKPGRESEVKHLAEKLVKEVRAGANFEEVSRQFSSSAASAGGKVEAFWIRIAQVEPHLAAVLGGAKVGTVTDPVLSQEGYTIVKVYEIHNAGGDKPASLKEASAVATVGSSAPVDETAEKRERAYQMLMQQKMELEAQKYLRNLRRETYIDVR